MKASEIIKRIENGELDERLRALYGASSAAEAAQRYCSILNGFIDKFGDVDNVSMFSAPGRTEIGGNHTDHNHGRVLAGAVNLDAVAAVAPTDDSMIHLYSDGFGMDTLSLSELYPKEEAGSSAALIRGVAARMKQLDMPIGGFNAYSHSTVLPGSGLSSSAAFEILLCSIMDGLYGKGDMQPIEAAKIGQYAENVYFGKPSGLMDQTACSVGGFVAIDFAEPDMPVVKPVNFDFAQAGYSLCITDTGGSHGDLTDCYSEIKNEMSAVAEYLGGKYLRECSKSALIDNAANIRAALGDRAFLRAYHFFCDDETAAAQAQALQNGDFQLFLSLVRQSGQSSISYLQNIYDIRNAKEQAILFALALTQEYLGSSGACRVHGGGFGGTIQAFVPSHIAKGYAEFMDKALGEGSCKQLFIRPFGGTRVEV